MNNNIIAKYFPNPEVKPKESYDLIYNSLRLGGCYKTVGVHIFSGISGPGSKKTFYNSSNNGGDATALRGTCKHFRRNR